MLIFFSVGEPSGDVHAARLIGELRKRRGDVRCVGFGGPRMREADCQLLHEMTRLAVMFFVGAAARLPRFLGLLRQAERFFRENPVDAVVLIDYPGLNWWIARAAKRRGIPVFYYGLPQLWAWAPWRIGKLRRWTDHRLCQLPFEPTWYAARGVETAYVGHPFFDERPAVEGACEMDEPQGGGEPWIVVLPGSRAAEVRGAIDCLLRAAARARETAGRGRIAVAAYNAEQADGAARRAAKLGVTCVVQHGRTPQWIARAHVCLACSGSVTLELLAARKPTVVYYRLSRLAAALQSFVLRARYVTLVNLMAAPRIERESPRLYDPDAAGSEPVPMPEYVSPRDCSAPIAAWLARWLADPQAYRAAVERLDRLARRDAQPGASRRAAERICAAIEQHPAVRSA